MIKKDMIYGMLNQNQLINIHRQLMRTPNYAGELKKWELQEVLLFSIDIKQQYIRRIKELMKYPEKKDTDWEYWMNETNIGLNVRREEALEKHLKHYLNNEAEKQKKWPAGLTMYGTPGDDYYSILKYEREASENDTQIELNEIEPKRKEPAPNEFRKGLEKKAKENEPKRKQFISEAKEFLSKKIKAGKPRSDYITDKGWPTVKFFRDPFRKSDIPKATRKDWIKKAVKTGEI